jgi:hypothetical protein
VEKPSDWIGASGKLDRRRRAASNDTDPLQLDWPKLPLKMRAFAMMWQRGAGRCMAHRVLC